jgi:hypothetical protein
VWVASGSEPLEELVELVVGCSLGGDILGLGEFGKLASWLGVVLGAG